MGEHIHTAVTRNESKNGVVFETCFCNAVRAVRDGEPEPWHPWPEGMEPSRSPYRTWLTILILLLGVLTLVCVLKRF